ncbi:hypothetical protein DL769_003550 [Monosporascus sp. CRB-8-3]|nr:hypothetical protein DL769_003550 [Monosporascus sp. CRB-8-3]
MPDTRGRNKHGREEVEQSDASSAVSPAAEFLDRLRGTPVWKKLWKKVKGLDDVEIDEISALLYQDDEGGDPDGRPLPSFRPSAGRAVVDGDDYDGDDYPYEMPGNEIAPYDTEEEARQEEAGSVVTDPARVLKFMVRMRMMGIDPFDADAIRDAGVQGDVSRADPEGKEDTRDNVSALAERLLEMD